MSTTIIDTPEGIEAYRLLAIRGRLQMELKGLRFKGRSTFAIVKEQFGLKGNNQRVFEQYETTLREMGVLHD